MDTKKKRGKIVQRNYILNDVAALQRKVKCETSRKQEFVMGKEAKNGSNIVVKMKTGFFEYVKAHFINELVNIDEILDIDNTEAAKANTENSGEAYVEFSMDIAFKAGEQDHKVKITAYTTTCSMTVQPIGEPPETTSLLL